MILSDQGLESAMNKGEIEVYPIDFQKQIQPASIDLRLGTHFRRMVPNQTISLNNNPDYQELNKDTIYIPEKSFILATTKESIRVNSDLSAFVEGRSSVGRLGLFVQNAGWIDPGFEGEITLELYNASCNEIKLKAGRRIAQLVVSKCDTHAKNPYDGKYKYQSGAVGSLIDRDEEVQNNK